MLTAEAACAQVVEQRVITPEQHTPEPLWATFCGTSGGLWNGQLAAFSPATGASVCTALCTDALVLPKLPQPLCAAQALPCSTLSSVSRRQAKTCRCQKTAGSDSCTLMMQGCQKLSAWTPRARSCWSCRATAWRSAKLLGRLGTACNGARCSSHLRRLQRSWLQPALTA